MPKRGFTSKFRIEYQVVNCERLNTVKAEKIDPKVLLENGLVKSKNKRVKILGEGKVTKALNVSAHAFSCSAVEKIKAAGGTTEVIKNA
jgi:large subunit ribosomal protein L15